MASARIILKHAKFPEINGYCWNQGVDVGWIVLYATKNNNSPTSERGGCKCKSESDTLWSADFLQCTAPQDKEGQGSQQEELCQVATIRAETLALQMAVFDTRNSLAKRTRTWSAARLVYCLRSLPCHGDNSWNDWSGARELACKCMIPPIF